MNLSHSVIASALLLSLTIGLSGEEIKLITPPNPLSQPAIYLQYYPAHYHAGVKNMFAWDFNKNLVKAGVILLPVAFLCDRSVKNFVVEHGLFPNNISNIGDVYGHRWGYIAAAAVVGIDGWISLQPWNKTFSQVELLATSALTTAVVTEVIKITTHRERPNGAGYKSLPSGHTSSSFSLAANLDEIYGHKVGIPAYLMAAFVASSRINDNKHYLSDTVAGALLGVWIGRSFARQYHFEWQISPVKSPALSWSIPL
jgi:membrane-associated phospholipid phosphatase